MPKKTDKSAVSSRTPEEAMDVGGESTTSQNVRPHTAVKKPEMPKAPAVGVSAASDTTKTTKSMGASISSDLEGRLARMENNVDRLTTLLTSQFGYDEEPEEDGLQESEECVNLLPGSTQDGGGDAPQPGGSQPQASTSHATDLWQKIQKELKMEEELASPLSDEVAAFLAKCLRKKPGLEAEKAMKEDKTFRQPSNCPELAVPIVEEAMWRKLELSTKNKDLAWQASQKTLLRGTTAVARAVDIVTALREPGMDEVVVTLTHALQHLAATNVDMCFRRREQIKTVLDGEYKAGLCAASVPITDKLFGGNLTEQVKDITEANKLTKRVFAGGKITRGRGSSASGYGRGSFRGNFRNQSSSPYWRGGQNRQGGRGRGGAQSGGQHFQFGRSANYWDSVANQGSKNGQPQQSKKQTQKE